MNFIASPRWQVLLVYTALVAGVSLHAAPDPIQRMLHALDPSTRVDDRKGFQDALAKNPANLEMWIAYCLYSFALDDPADTLNLLKEATTRIPSSPELWQLQAEVYWLDAKSGPGWYTRPGMSAGRKVSSPLSEEEFRKQSLERALAALDRVLALKPGDRETAGRRGEVLIELARWPEAADVFGQLLAGGREKDPGMIAKRSYALFKGGRVDEASAELDAGLAAHPRSADLHMVRSHLLAETDAVAAAEEKRQAEFYWRMVPGGSLDYTPERAESLVRMFGRKEGTSGMFSGDRLNQQIGAEIDRLHQQGDEEARELLAALAWSHYAHGELEDKAFASLGKAGDIGRLNRIYEHAQSACTLGGCLRELVRSRAPGTFERLQEQLANDGGMFGIGVIPLMVELGDPRAMTTLISYSRDKEAPLFSAALVALGWFDSDETRRHLEYWFKDKEAQPFAAAALYRITRDEKWIKPLQKLKKPGDLYDLATVAEALEGIDTPSAKKILKTYETLRAKREAGRRAKQK